MQGVAATAAAPASLGLVPYSVGAEVAATAAASALSQGPAATAAVPACLHAGTVVFDGPVFHDSHVVYCTESFAFCARCGAYSALATRRSGGLQTECRGRGAPSTQNGVLVRNRLMRGIEPVRPLRHTGRAAVPLCPRPMASETL